MIEARGLTKVYGDKTAVDDISFDVRPGIVTGFLGPNGAGKSTTMRMIVGLDRPTAGSVTVNGKNYAAHPAPMSEVGALLEARAVHPGRTARQHLRVLAATHGIPDSRVDEVIEITGLESVANKRVGGFSLGMGQRLGIASALLGDPKTLILDEPVNGLDPEGVLWIRNLARYLAGQGRTVFLSSHLMSEVAQTADEVIVIGRGKILANAPVADFISASARQSVRVASPHMDRLIPAIVAAGGKYEILEGDRAEVAVFDVAPAPVGRHAAPTGSIPVVSPIATGQIEVTGLSAPDVGSLASVVGATLAELTPIASTLEDAYMALTADSVEYQTVDVGARAAADAAAGELK